NPDYEPTANEFGAFHAVAPPGNIDLLSAEAHKISIENSKYLGGDLVFLLLGLAMVIEKKVDENGVRFETMEVLR
nr:suppressor of mec-8 and unc-52 protein homolog 2 [Tanacetum cinerariifolium]